jgi:hypothetical protein
MKKSSYMTRALTASDPRFARVLGKLGYERSDVIAADPLDHDSDGKKGGSPSVKPSDDLTTLRTKYSEKFGKRPFHGWDAMTLTEKLAEEPKD